MATDSGAGWELSDVETRGDPGRWGLEVRMARDDSLVHVLFADLGTDQLGYAYGHPGAWTFEDLSMSFPLGGAAFDLDAGVSSTS